MSISVEYDKTLVYKGLIEIWILLTPTSNTHNLFYLWGIHKQVFALDYSEVELSFPIKLGAFKAW